MKESASWKTWAVILVLIGLMVAGAFALRPDLLDRAKLLVGWQDAEPEVTQEKVDASKEPKKRKKVKRRAKKPTSDALVEEPQDETWEDIEFGNIFEEPDDEPSRVPAEAAFVPPPDMWQPDGSYRPSAGWTSPGFNPAKPQEIDLNGPDAKPLTESQIKTVLNEKRLMPCYRDVAIKVPGMKGDVEFQGNISTNGQILNIQVKRSELRSRQVESCMVSTVRKLKFPSAGGPTTFTMDFHFN